MCPGGKRQSWDLNHLPEATLNLPTGSIGWAPASVLQHLTAGVSEKENEVSWCPGHSEMTKPWTVPVSGGNLSGPSNSRASLFPRGILRTHPEYGALIGTASWKGRNAEVSVSTESRSRAESDRRGGTGNTWVWSQKP